MYRILEGLRVVEVSAFVAGPFGGLTLSQLGAEVIRIDPPGGGLDYKRWPLADNGESLYWQGLNKGKLSVAIDVRNPEGRELAQGLMTAPGETSGILVTNIPARGWLDYEGLKAKREDLIMVAVNGNRDGSVALDYTVNAAAGFPFLNGPVGNDQPINHVLAAWDLIAGLWVANAALVAERHRRDTGAGQQVRLALSDCALSVLSHLGMVAEVSVNDQDRPRLGNHVYGTFGHDFGTSDGRRVMITAFTRRHWKVLVEGLGMAEKIAQLGVLLELNLDEDAGRFAGREAIAALFRPWFAARTLEQVAAALNEAGTCWGPYQTVRQAVEEDPRLSTENPMYSQVEHPDTGSYLTAGSILDFSGAERQAPGRARRLGEDTEAVLANVLGVDANQYAKLRDAGVVG